MAENITLARPYADAVFRLARSAGALGPWQEALERMALVASDGQMAACIKDPHLQPGELAQLFIEVAGPLTAEQQNFVRLLVENDRLRLLPEIRDLFIALKNDEEGVREAAITSAFPLDETTLRNLVADLEARFGCRIRAHVSVDPELIGGVRIAVGDQVIDASVRGKLAAMAVALQS